MKLPKLVTCFVANFSPGNGDAQKKGEQENKKNEGKYREY